MQAPQEGHDLSAPRLAPTDPAEAPVGEPTAEAHPPEEQARPAQAEQEPGKSFVQRLGLGSLMGFARGSKLGTKNEAEPVSCSRALSCPRVFLHALL